MERVMTLKQYDKILKLLHKTSSIFKIGQTLGLDFQEVQDVIDSSDEAQKILGLTNFKHIKNGPSSRVNILRTNMIMDAIETDIGRAYG